MMTSTKCSTSVLDCISSVYLSPIAAIILPPNHPAAIILPPDGGVTFCSVCLGTVNGSISIGEYDYNCPTARAERCVKLHHIDAETCMGVCRCRSR